MTAVAVVDGGSRPRVVSQAGQDVSRVHLLTEEPAPRVVRWSVQRTPQSTW